MTFVHEQEAGAFLLNPPLEGKRNRAQTLELKILIFSVAPATLIYASLRHVLILKSPSWNLISRCSATAQVKVGGIISKLLPVFPQNSQQYLPFPCLRNSYPLRANIFHKGHKITALPKYCKHNILQAIMNAASVQEINPSERLSRAGIKGKEAETE